MVELNRGASEAGWGGGWWEGGNRAGMGEGWRERREPRVVMGRG